MSFSNDLNKIATKNKDNLQMLANKRIESAKEKLIEIMGDDLHSITSITFNLEAGKFEKVEAPESAKNKLREADLIIE
ncbi:hypothetical protein AADZ91_06995 [Colwelliaceae bacterium 6441]